MIGLCKPKCHTVRAALANLALQELWWRLVQGQNLQTSLPQSLTGHPPMCVATRYAVSKGAS